ncbi:GNAT family N-acetyltransferase [Lacibacter luteus]|nr:GNAT family N-acetyltransferase [Lacibacter luteus]
MILFQSERLLVKPYSNADGDIFFRFHGDEEVMRFIRKPKTREESDAFLIENLKFYKEHPGIGRFAVIEKVSGEHIGSFSLLPLEDTVNYHLGYGFLQKAWGKGFATELVAASIDYTFRAIQREIIMAITLPQHIASQKVLLKAGFVESGTIIQEGEILKMFCLQKKK